MDTSLTGFYSDPATKAMREPTPKLTTDDQLQSARQSLTEAGKSKGMLQQAQAGEKAEQTKMLAEADVQGREAFKKAVETDPFRAEYREKVKEQADTKFVPTQETAGDLGLLFTLTNILGFAIGGKSKGNAQAAMSAMNGMLEGHQKGRQDIYKQEKDKFDENFKTLDKTIQSLKTQYEDAMKTYANDREEGMAKARMAIAEHNARFIQDSLEKFGPAYAYDQIRDTVSMLEKAKVAEQKLQDAQDKRERDERMLQLREREAAEAARHHSVLEAQGAGRMETSKEKLLTKEVLPIIQGIRGVEHLQDQLRDPEVQKGLLSRAAPFFEKLNSLGNDKEFESAVNNAVELTGVDKTTLFLKDALLEQYAIDRAAKNGQRLTVQDIKMTGPVLDPTNYSPQTYNALLDNRRKVLYNNAQDYGLSPQDIAEKTRQRPYTPYGGQAPTAAPAPAAPAKTSGGVTVSNW